MRKIEITDTDYEVIINSLKRYRDEMREEVDAAHKAFEPTIAYAEWINACIAVVHMESQA